MGKRVVLDKEAIIAVMRKTDGVRKVRSLKALSRLMGKEYTSLLRLLRGGGFNSTTLGRIASTLGVSPKRIIKWETDSERDSSPEDNLKQ